MTEVIRYRCKKCGTRYGPMGMHGFSPTDGAGELPVTCPTCKTIEVGRFEDGALVSPLCRQCSTPLERFEGLCPACRTKSMVFEDLAIPGFERPVD